MPDTDTIDRVISRKVQVASLPPADSGRGFARLPDKLMDELGLSEGDVIEVVGKRTTAARAIRPYGEDEGIDIIRLDGLQRANAGVGSGDFVEVRKADSKPATRVVFAPAQPNVRLQGSADALKRTFAGRPVVEGDTVSTTGHQRINADMPDHIRQLLNAPAFALQELRLVVVSAAPKGIVHIDNSTAIELLPEYTARDGEGQRRADVTYDDLGGMRDTIDALREMVELPLRHPELFQRLGVDPPKGVLLHGPPGTGKTLLARAVANESAAKFFHIAGPEIMGSAYGESERRLREVFEQAAESAPSIIFIDEIDSIAPKRSQVTGEAEKRLVAQLLTLLDGMEPRQNTVVIAATNRPEAIDEALRRPGRFDREIVVGVPDDKGRREILGIHTRGMPLANDKLREGIELPLKHPDAFKRLGIRPAKGFLLYGPPGTGKTLLAKAAARESEANFIATKSSDLLSKWYGESEQQIARLFARARQVAPTVIFIDELDSLVPARGGGLGEPQVTERVVNTILAEMDGLEELQGVVLIGATNRPNLIDPALLRPGRFDELVYVGPPDTAGRRRILAIHTKGMPLAKDVDLESLARRAERFTGADLGDLVRRAGLTALRRALDSAQVTKADFEAALAETRASVTEEMLDDYAKIQETLKADAVRPNGGIGFVLPGMLHPRGPGKPEPGKP